MRRLAHLGERATTVGSWERVSGIPLPIKVYDDERESFDRYTVVLDEPGTKRGRDFTALSLSANPGHPQGVSQFTTAQDGPHLGKRLKFSDLPDNVQKHVIRRFAEGEAKEGRVGRRLAGMGERAATKSEFKHEEGRVTEQGRPTLKQAADAALKLLNALADGYPDIGADTRVARVRKDLQAAIHGFERGEAVVEHSAPTGEDLAHEIEQEIGRWLEDEEEFELGDINDSIGAGERGEAKTLESNILFIVARELDKKLGAGAAKGVTVELGNFDNSEEDDRYRAGGDFRIWHAGDSYAQGSFAATGMADELQDMTINITQASGHSKKNAPLRFW